jgi:periplasmic protein CpxP/Spy
MKSFRKHLFLGAIALGLGGSAFAADTTMCEPMEPMMQGQQMGRMDHASMSKNMQMRMEQRHAALHDKLKLSAEQEPAWKEFMAGAKAPMMGSQMQRADMMKMSAPERMEKMVEHMKQREAFMATRLSELKKFYDVLTPEQQKVFDTETMMGARGGSTKRGSMRGHAHGPASSPAPAPK